MSGFDSIQDYYCYIKNRVEQSSCCTDSSAIRLVPSRKAWLVRARKMKFVDGAFLEFNEAVEIDKGKILRLKYSYHYQRPDPNGIFYFRYDRDSACAKPITHEEYHLHVRDIEDPSGKELRFKTHETSFREIFDFIRVCFYAEEP